MAQLELKHVEHAWEHRAPELAQLIVALSAQPDPQPERPLREGALTFDRFVREIYSRTFRRLPWEQQMQRRQEMLRSLEASDAEVPLSDRLRLHHVVLQLWEAADSYSRAVLLEVIAEVPLRFGVWRALKTIFKEAEAQGDWEIYGALVARLDAARGIGGYEVSQRTLAYLCRRGWRTLRRLGQTLPACYADAAAAVLIHYRDQTAWPTTWVANHIFYHELGNYSRTRFHFTSRTGALLKHRAFAELWRRSPRPLFGLLERAQSEHVLRYAASALRTDFRATLREVEPAWVARLVGVARQTVHDFVVWILENVPKFEQASFREMGLHEPVLQLFDSPSSTARGYAAKYARTHARDLDAETLVRLAGNDHKEVWKLACDLLRAREPRTEVGLELWGKLLDCPRSEGATLAADVLRKQFGKRELSVDWFRQRLVAARGGACDFAIANLAQLHPPKSLGGEFFCEVIDQLELGSLGGASAPAAGRRPESRRAESRHRRVVLFAAEQLEKLGVDSLNASQLQRLLLHPLAQDYLVGWVAEGRLNPQLLTADFLKTVAFHPRWEAWEGRAELERLSPWARGLAFSEALSEHALGWLSDVRVFSPDDLGFSWLMELVQRSEPRYHHYAVETLTKAFLPADFATDAGTDAGTASDAASGTGAAGDQAAQGDDEIQVDFQGASFVFTGKLATMTRKEAQQKVTAAGGANASAVTKNLDYLVIGDEGSPLYGEGRKGSKQVKAEKLRDDGAALQIISETAFLQMLVGGQREYSEGDVHAGCERLWEMLTAAGKADDPLRLFARHYLRRHHPEICLAETDRPVDPGAEIPASFLTFERVAPLFQDARRPLRELALEWARYELAGWAPPIERIVAMCEVPHPEVRELFALALTAEDLPEHKRYRLDPAVLTPDAVYSFCESRDEPTRALGMRLLDLHPRLRVPQELFRLTESPDRRMRAFVVRALWSLYRDRGITEHWRPRPPVRSQLKKGKRPAEPPREVGAGPPPRPEDLPAGDESLRELLRRMLFEIPPGRPPKLEARQQGERLKPLPARKAKLYLIEVLRDLAVEQPAFASVGLPVLEEFMGSRGQSEQAACLVAVTRIRAAHPQLQLAEEFGG